MLEFGQTSKIYHLSAGDGDCEVVLSLQLSLGKYLQGWSSVTFRDHLVFMCLLPYCLDGMCMNV